jgi:hypothetical protein
MVYGSIGQVLRNYERTISYMGWSARMMKCVSRDAKIDKPRTDAEPGGGHGAAVA